MGKAARKERERGTAQKSHSRDFLRGPWELFIRHKGENADRQGPFFGEKRKLLGSLSLGELPPNPPGKARQQSKEET